MVKKQAVIFLQNFTKKQPLDFSEFLLQQALMALL